MRFESQPAYQGANDRFAVQTALDLADETLHPRAELHVVRRTPLRGR